VSLDGLIRAVASTAAESDVLGRQFAIELASVLRSLERRLRPLVKDAAEGSRTRIIQAGIANRTRKALEDSLVQSGYSRLAETVYGARLDALVEHVLATRRLANQAAKLSGAFEQRIQAIKYLHETDLLDEGDTISRLLWQAVTRGVFNAQPVDGILADLYDVVDASESQIRTLYDTSVSIFARQVEALQASADPDTPFVYMGPADKKTRPFCREHVGKVYTRAEINELDNGQIDNVFLTCGGFNCRHMLVEVSQFSELADYVGTDRRVPEIAMQLQEAA
jgi:hypothetical protein